MEKKYWARILATAYFSFLLGDFHAKIGEISEATIINWYHILGLFALCGTFYYFGYESKGDQMDSSHLKTIKNIMSTDKGRRFSMTDLKKETKFSDYIIREVLGFYMDAGFVRREAKKYFWRINYEVEDGE